MNTKTETSDLKWTTFSRSKPEVRPADLTLHVEQMLMQTVDDYMRSPSCVRSGTRSVAWMRRTTAWGPIRSARPTARPVTGCAVNSSTGEGRLRCTWNCSSPWSNVHRGSHITGPAKRPLTFTITRVTRMTRRQATPHGWRTLIPRCSYTLNQCITA